MIRLMPQNMASKPWVYIYIISIYYISKRCIVPKTTINPEKWLGGAGRLLSNASTLRGYVNFREDIIL